MHARRGVRLLVAGALLASPLAPTRGAVAGPLRAAGLHALPRLTPTRHDALTRALARGSISRAQYALERALSLFHPGLVEARFGAIGRPDPHDATMILRDLFIRKRQLSGSELRQANSLLARPSDRRRDFPGAAKWTVTEAAASPFCSANVCVHWVDSTADAPPPADVAPADGIPDWVATTDATLENVWTQEVTNMGYRAPESDSSSRNHGPDGKLDIYLANLLPDGLFGYCTSDDPKIPPPWDVSAYCVLDNDYLGYGYTDPEAPLDVTAAHEFFHAVQFAYDAYEDRWMMEATAVWMEGEVYGAIHDNYAYLPYGPLGAPGVPLDKGGTGLHQYGSWIFFRFLSEYPLLDGPTIIRDIWDQADGANGGPDLYSTAAIARAITLQGQSFGNLFATFAEWAAAPDLQFEEGADYPAAKVAKTSTLRSSDPSFARTSFVLDHLANAYAVILPGAGISGTAKLRVSVDGPDASTGPQASIVILRKDGTAGYVRLTPNANGNGSRRVAFGKGTVREVIVILTNASRRFRNCQPHFATTIWSCSGVPRDDNQTYSFRAKLV